MKQTLKRLATVMGIVWLVWVSALLYWMVAPRIFGPEKAVRAMHELIQPGMTTSALETLSSQDKGLKITSINATEEKYVSKLTGSWLCTFSVHIQNETVHSIKDVICVD